MVITIAKHYSRVNNILTVDGRYIISASTLIEALHNFLIFFFSSYYYKVDKIEYRIDDELSKIRGMPIFIVENEVFSFESYTGGIVEIR